MSPTSYQLLYPAMLECKGKQNIGKSQIILPYGHSAITGGRFCPGNLQSVEVAEKQFPVIPTQMHTSALAIAPPSAITASSGFSPTSVAVRLETIFPDFNEIIPVNVSLVEVGPYASTSGDAAVCEH